MRYTKIAGREVELSACETLRRRTLLGRWAARSLLAFVITAIIVLVAIPYIRMKRLINRADSTTFVGQPAPNVEFVTYEEKPWRLKDQRSKLVILDYWGVWCAPCRAALPEIRKLRDKYRDRSDFLLVGVCVGDRDQHRSFCRDNQIDWLQLYSKKEPGAEPQNQFPIYSVPSVWIIDRDGKVIAADLRGEQVDATVDASMRTARGSCTK